MPGIHVRTSRKLDWVAEEKEPILTVPGSYWLCHKKNIYKFTFKYHRSSKDTKEFNYGKELMKVIRRIIKSQPRQGQQFGTRHLLVTFSHSSWTRQDKMFAMLKFRDRTNATAFPRAFVLLVKILSTNATFENDKEFDDELVVYENSSRRLQWNNKPQNDKNSDDKISEQPTSTIGDNNVISNDGLTKQDNIRNQTSVNTPVTRSMRSHERQKKVCSASFFAGLDDLPLLERYLSEQPSNSDNSANQECLNELQETTVDMPYQYLIEREIERTKSRQTVNSNAQKMIVDESTGPKEKRAESTTPRNSKAHSTLNVIDNATARSANITDLVMEGLMFTIRQDQDSVTVVEQKTKLEPDEVLENSEKIETKEGAECLVNSSLLKLENLVGKIEMSSSAKAAKYDEDPSTITQLNTFGAIDVNKADDEKEKKERLTGKEEKEEEEEEEEEEGEGDEEAEEDEEEIEVDVEAEVETDPKTELLEQRKNTLPLVEKLLNDVTEDSTNLEVIDDNKSEEVALMELSLELRKSPTVSLAEQSKDVPLVTINVSNVHNVLNNDFINDSGTSSTSPDVHSIHEALAVNNKFDVDQGLQVHENSNIEEDDKKLNDNDELDEEIDEDIEEEEDLIPEAFLNKKRMNDDDDNDNINYELSSDDEENNLLMDDIDAELPVVVEPPVKTNGPRIISSEVVQYDLSSLRTLNMRKRLESDSKNTSTTSSTNNDNNDKNTSTTSSINNNDKSPSSSGMMPEEEPTNSTEKNSDKKSNEPTVTTRRKLTAKRRLCLQKQEDEAKVKIEMKKFVEDMTYGVRVVLERLDLEKISEGLKKNGSFKCVN